MLILSQAYKIHTYIGRGKGRDIGRDRGRELGIGVGIVIGASALEAVSGE